MKGENVVVLKGRGFNVKSYDDIKDWEKEGEGKGKNE